MTMILDGTNGETFPDGSQQAVAAIPYSENPVINGEMLIDQANAGAAVSMAITTPTYLVDMWYGFTAGHVANAQQVAGSGEFAQALQASGQASVTGITLGTRIESKNAAQFLNKTITCQAHLSNSLLTTVTWTAFYPTVADTFSTKTQIATGTITVNATDTAYNFSFVAGANVGKGLCIEFSVGTQPAGTFTVTGVDIIAGSGVRPYPHLTYERVLSQCQRYYETSYAYGTAIGTATSTNQLVSWVATANLQRLYEFSSRMISYKCMVNSKILIYSPATGAVNNCRNDGTVADVPCATSTAINSPFTYFLVFNSNQTASQQIRWHYVIDCRL